MASNNKKTLKKIPSNPTSFDIGSNYARKLSGLDGLSNFESRQKQSHKVTQVLR